MRIFLDIITAPKYTSFNELQIKEPKMAKIWLNKCKEEEYDKIAALEPEFAKIVGIGILFHANDKARYRISINANADTQEPIKSERENGDLVTVEFRDEAGILDSFKAALDKFTENNGVDNVVIVGCSNKTFDIPFICRKFMIHNKTLPNLLKHIPSKRTWDLEKNFYDVAVHYGAQSFSKFSNNIDALLEVHGFERTEFTVADLHSLYLNENYDAIKEYLYCSVSGCKQLYNKIVELQK